MSAVLDRSDVALERREPEFSIPSSVTPISAHHDPTVSLRRRRRVVVALLIGLVGIVALQMVVGVLMAAQRQRHLAHEVLISDPKIGPGEAAMILQAPKIGLNVVVAEGASSKELRGGPGHVVGSAGVADGGNVVVLGRRTRFGAAFNRLGELSKGDEVVVRSRQNEVRGYVVESVRRFETDDATPLRSAEDRLTLVTSAPGLLPTKRLVVVARALTPPANPPAVSVASRLGADALDERSTSVVGVGAGVVFLVGASIAIWIGVRRLRQTYTVVTVLQVAVPLVCVVMVVALIIGDAVLPVTY